MSLPTHGNKDDTARSGMGRVTPLQVVCHYVTFINNSQRHRLSYGARSAKMHAYERAHIDSGVNKWMDCTPYYSLVAFLHYLLIRSEILTCISTKETARILFDNKADVKPADVLLFLCFL